MSDRDPPRLAYHQSITATSPARSTSGNGRHDPSTPTHQLNPAVGKFQPINTPPMSEASQSSPYRLERKVNDLEREQGTLRTDVDKLKNMYNDLHESLDKFQKGGWDVKVGPFMNQSAEQFRKELNALTAEAKVDNSGAGDHEKLNTAPSVTTNTPSFVPPHLRGKDASKAQGTSKPPHIRQGPMNGNIPKETPLDAKPSANNPLVTDGVVEAPARTSKARGLDFTPPDSPTRLPHPDDPIPSIENLAINPVFDKTWIPHFLTTLAPLKPEAADRIPSASMMKSFAPDFLRNTFDGIQWSPGFNFVPPSPGPCILRNRSYYTLDAQFEPYLPSKPGVHGAKLVPFFNENPEDHYDLPEGFDSTSANVPLFVMRPDGAGRMRYYYFGHYSQTRWSDKLDYDRMVQCVPTKVREYWAAELASAGRPEWITNALLKHFFPKPIYEGRMFGKPVEEGGSVMSAEVDKREEKVLKDVKAYASELREWEKESRMKTAMIKKDFILQAFDRADADDPPALRLWWEYLECIDWKKDFYDMLVTLQARNPNYERY